jgi:hypothetical protein
MSYRKVHIYTCDCSGCGNTYEIDDRWCSGPHKPASPDCKSPRQWAIGGGWFVDPMVGPFVLCHECDPIGDDGKPDDRARLEIFDAIRKRKSTK